MSESLKITTWRTEAREHLCSLLDAVKDKPDLVKALADALVPHLEWPESREIAKRLNMLIPNNLSLKGLSHG